MIRSASAVWQGGLKDGKGTVSTQSGVLQELPYSFRTRFETEPGTNPEELIAAAHAGCFSMALSAELGKVSLTPEAIRTTATLTLDSVQTGWTVTQIHLDVKVKMLNADAGRFKAAANTSHYWHSWGQAPTNRHSPAGRCREEPGMRESFVLVLKGILLGGAGVSD